MKCRVFFQFFIEWVFLLKSEEKGDSFRESEDGGSKNGTASVMKCSESEIEKHFCNSLTLIA